MVALLTSVRNSPCFGGLPRTKTCHRQLFARPSTCFLVTFCTMQKVTIRSLCREHRGSANLEAAHQNSKFAQTNLNPFEPFLAESFAPSGAARSACKNSLSGTSRFRKPRSFSPPKAASHSRFAAISRRHQPPKNVNFTGCAGCAAYRRRKDR